MAKENLNLTPWLPADNILKSFFAAQEEEIKSVHLFRHVCNEDSA